MGCNDPAVPAYAWLVWLGRARAWSAGVPGAGGGAFGSPLRVDGSAYCGFLEPALHTSCTAPARPVYAVIRADAAARHGLIPAPGHCGRIVIGGFHELRRSRRHPCRRPDGVLR